jgi:hypothetical protein
MPKRKPINKGLFHIFGLEINLNSILTSVFGTLACMLVTWGILRLGAIAKNVGAIPHMQAALIENHKAILAVKSDVENIKTEQARIRTQYSPPVPSPTP